VLSGPHRTEMAGSRLFDRVCSVYVHILKTFIDNILVTHTFTSHFIILYICLSIVMSIFYLINLFNFMLGCGLPTHIKAIFDLI